ncbi:MAG TPA: preprotein translocase subunit SecG [Thermodesulfobacteriota bacterium]|nr:preprotein translocase subunit SecG [Thermodesulfobacteriota bacterium]
MELIIFSVKIIHIIVSILLIIVVLLQPGKSGDLGSIFGGGTSESIFGSSGAVPFLVKVTRGLAILFMLTSLSLGYFAASSGGRSVVTDVPGTAVEETVPAGEAPADVTAPADQPLSPEAPVGNEAVTEPEDATGSQGEKTDEGAGNTGDAGQNKN